MRYIPEHKQRTRVRILKQAGRIFRRHGYDGVGIDGIMAAAKLTRGGFYGYFKSKTDLFVQVMRGEHGFNAMLRRRDGADADALTRQALEIIDGYLDPANRQTIGQGCTMASLSIDVARAPKPVRQAYGVKVRELAGEFARGLDSDALDPRALRSVALCVGGIIISRASEDRELNARLTAACRDAVRRELTGPAQGRT